MIDTNSRVPRAQEVINACTAMGPQNPIKFIHDVGAGGLSNALPELVHDAGLGATFELREIDSADESMSPLQVWCCEAQERYVMAVGQDGLNVFKRIADRYVNPRILLRPLALDRIECEFEEGCGGFASFRTVSQPENSAKECEIPITSTHKAVKTWILSPGKTGFQFGIHLVAQVSP